MSIESELVTRLEDDSGVGGIAGNRIYPVVLPQSPTYPAITYQRVSGSRVHNLGGTAGRARPRMSFSCWATTYSEAVSLAAAVRASLDGFNGTLATIDAEIKIENEYDRLEDEASENGIYRIVQDYFVHHVET